MTTLSPLDTSQYAWPTSIRAEYTIWRYLLQIQLKLDITDITVSVKLDVSEL